MHPSLSFDGSIILHTLIVKHFNDLLERQSSERSKDEISYFYLDMLATGLSMPIFKKKSS